VEEATKPTPHPKLRIAQAREADAFAVGRWSRGARATARPDDAEVRARLKDVDSGVRSRRRRAGDADPVVARDEANVRKLRRERKLSRSRRMP
jgi:hypothetical protein